MTSDRSLLIVDDSLTARMKLKQLLEGCAATVQLESSGEAGTKSALEMRPDVAILDVVLPDTDGISLCREWQKHPELESMPIILISGQRSDRDDRLAGLRSGAMGYLVKPFDDDEMIALVDTLCRLRQIAHEQSQLNAELTRRNTELRTFAHVVSHDLKAPLRAIGSLVDCVTADYLDVLDELGREQLSLIKGRTQRMYELIGGILRYSSSEVDATELQDVESGSVVAGVIESLAIPAEVEVSMAGELPTVRYSSVQLQQVFQNLIGNAIQHLDRPSGRIEVSAERGPEEICFTVEDDGPGIPAGQRERIFEVFQTLAPRDEHESVGVGLAIVAKIVDQNGGRVWVEPAPERGSRFRFTVPVERDRRTGRAES